MPVQSGAEIEELHHGVLDALRGPLTIIPLIVAAFASMEVAGGRGSPWLIIHQLTSIVIAGVLWWRRGPTRVRRLGLCGAVTLSAGCTLFHYGPLFGTGVFFMAATLAAAFFLGRRGTVSAIAVLVTFIALAAWGSRARWLVPTYTFPTVAGWVRLGVGATFLLTACGILFDRVHRFGLDALRAEVAARKSLVESDRRHRDIVNSLPQLAWTCNREGECDFLNSRWVEYTGIQEKLQLGFGWLDQLHPDDRDRTRAAWQDAVANNREFECEVRIRRADGAYRWFKTLARQYHDANGVARWLGSNTDIDAQKQADEERARFMLGIDRSNDAIFMTVRDGTIHYVNRAFEELYGFTSAEAVGKTPRILKSGAYNGQTYQRLWERLLAKQVVTSEMVNKSKDGRTVEVESSANPILDERGDVVGFLAIQRDITERKRAENEARASEERFRVVFHTIPLPTFVTDATTLEFLEVNDAAVRVYGRSREEFLKMSSRDIGPPEEVARYLEAIASDPRGSVSLGVFKQKKKDGTVFDAEIVVHSFVFAGRPARLTVAQDVSERQRMYAQLVQSQKMEAVGRLAGGVAHDFNNLMSVILSYSDLLIGDLERDDPMRSDLEEIKKAGERAAGLTRQLLAFSRKQVLAPQAVNLNDVIAPMHKMLRRLIGEDVELVTVPAADLGTVLVDPGQIEQVVMNLAVNARDAMPRGGKLTIETANVQLDERYSRAHAGTKPGSYVMLAVSDTGTGMDPATQARIFEPFFTTKEVGKGSGLGLSTVLGIVEQSGGSINVYSEVGKGTAFKIYFLRTDVSVEVAAPSPASNALRGNESVLLVEDDESVRCVARAILEGSGYHVIEATDAREAMLVCEREQDRIALVVTDVVMPGMSGPEVARRLVSLHPQMKVLCMSGYTDEAIVNHGFLGSGIAFLQKPFTPESLARKVREVLDTA